jgi:hypothetical protein
MVGWFPILFAVKTATHPKFGQGTVVEEREDAGARVLTIDFPQHGRKRLRAEFVEVIDAAEATRHLRSAALEEAIRRVRPDQDPAPHCRAYGEWLHERGDAHARLISLQNDPPERGDVDWYAYRARLEKLELALVRDVAVLGPLADAVHSGHLACRFERGFVAHAELGPADPPRLAALVELLSRTRHTAFLRSVSIRANQHDELACSGMHSNDTACPAPYAGSSSRRPRLTSRASCPRSRARRLFTW